MSIGLVTPLARRRRSRISQPHRIPVSVLRGAAGLALLALLWWLAGLTGHIDTEAMPTLPQAVSDLVTLVALPGFWVTLGYTLQSTFVGLASTIVIGLPLAVLIAESRWARRALLPTIEALRPIPPIVLLPIVLLIAGANLKLGTILVLQGALWAFLIQASYGVDAIDPVLLDTTRSYHIGGWRRLLLVRIPAAAAVIVSGLRLAASAAFGVSVMTELVGGVRGLGSIIAVAQSGNDVARVYSITICTGLVGIAIAWGFGRLQRLTVNWLGASEQ